MATEDDALTASSGKLTTTLGLSGSIGARLGSGTAGDGVFAGALATLASAVGALLCGVDADSVSLGAGIAGLFSGVAAGGFFSCSAGCSGGLGGSGSRSSAVRKRMLCIRIVPVNPSIVPVITTSLPKNVLALS